MDLLVSKHKIFVTTITDMMDLIFQKFSASNICAPYYLTM